MKIITVSREFGSGGRELGKRLSDILGFDYYDREIITAIAKNSSLDESFVDYALEQQPVQVFTTNLRCSFATAPAVHSIQPSLLLEQKKVIDSIAAKGRDCVIVGRNADVLLQDYEPFNIFVCADMESRIERCLSRASGDESRQRRDIVRNIRRIDKVRARTRELISGSDWGDRGQYHLTVNTSGWDIRELAPAVADFAGKWFGRAK